jgi:hypothetical protein
MTSCGQLNQCSSHVFPATMIFGTQQYGSQIETITSSQNSNLDHQQQLEFIAHSRTNSQQTRRTISNFLITTFLPIGYPSSVKSEYLTYQIYDTIQALSSYLRSVLCTHALLVAAGVGTTDANAMSAAITWIIKDGIGMFFSIFFTSTCSIYFGSYIKEWRLFADLINDLALSIDLVTPFFPRDLHLYILTISAICKTMCGISANSTKLCITNHLCLQANEADVNAKEGSQETAVCLIGLILGMIMSQFLASSSSSPSSSSYVLFIFLTSLHVYCNYYAVKCLQLQSINRTRGYLLFKSSLSLLFPSSLLDSESHQSHLLSILSPNKKSTGKDLLTEDQKEEREVDEEEGEKKKRLLFLQKYHSLHYSPSPLSIASINSQDSLLLTLKLSCSSLSPISNIFIGISLQDALNHLDLSSFSSSNQSISKIWNEIQEIFHLLGLRYCILPRQGYGYSVLVRRETSLLDQYEAYCRCLFLDLKTKMKKQTESSFLRDLQETSESFAQFWKGFVILLKDEVLNSFLSSLSLTTQPSFLLGFYSPFVEMGSPELHLDELFQLDLQLARRARNRRRKRGATTC